MRISDWSSDVCSSDLRDCGCDALEGRRAGKPIDQRHAVKQHARRKRAEDEIFEARLGRTHLAAMEGGKHIGGKRLKLQPDIERQHVAGRYHHRSEEHTYELQSLMPISYSVL